MFHITELLWFLFFVLPLCHTFRNGSTGGRNYCEKEIFRNALREGYDPFNYTRRNCHADCSMMGKRVLLDTRKNESGFLTVRVISSDILTEECWGYAVTLLELLERGYIVHQETYFYNETVVQNYQLQKGKVYLAQLCLLPSCPNQLTSSGITFDDCTMSTKKFVIQYYSDKAPKCGEPDISQVEQFTDKFCLKRKNFVEAEVAERLLIHNCMIIYQQIKVKVEKKGENNINWRMLSLIITGSVVVFIASIGGVFYVRRVILAKMRSDMTSFNDNIITPNEGVTTKLMILHCPGCDVLDVFVRDFAFVLESYGLKVKSALLEQTTIDAEGGISSYIQRNIEECHYILLIFSEQVKELNFPKHRPFQFALRILGGLAFSETKKPTYIPLYFTEQKKAMQMIPTFLYPSMGNGFRLPNELKPLISKLKGNQKITSSEKPARLNFFTEKMKNQILKILKNSHQECACDGCNKGEIQYPESELWGTETITSYGKLIENSRLETRSISNNVPSRPNSHESDISINKIINQKTLIENWCNDNFDSDLSNKYVFDTLL